MFASISLPSLFLIRKILYGLLQLSLGIVWNLFEKASHIIYISKSDKLSILFIFLIQKCGIYIYLIFHSFLWLKCVCGWVYMNCVTDSCLFPIQYPFSPFSLLIDPQRFSRRQYVQLKRQHFSARNDKVICILATIYQWKVLLEQPIAPLAPSSFFLPGTCIQCPEMDQLSWEHDNENHT